MTKRPNFIVFMTDDQGYADLSCMGAEDFQTPNIDRLAENGVRFEDWHANSPVCSPSRASLLTGRYPARAGVRSILAGHRTASGLSASVPTLSSELKKAGYNTYMVGKWHLGVNDVCRPRRHGFDHWFGFLAGCVDYFSHIFYWGMNKPGPGINPTHDLWEDDEEVWQYNGEYLTDLLTGKAVAYLREAAQKEEPFLLYVAYNAPHYPMHAPPEYMERFAHLPWERQVMAAMISAVDDGVGKILKTVEDAGLLEDTCVFFMSDNGPSRETRNWLNGCQDPYFGGSSGRFRGHKSSLFEGGHRVPGLMMWQGHIPGGRVLQEPCAAMDVMPTLLSFAGIDSKDDDFDGLDLSGYLLSDQALPERLLFWEYGDQTAVRRGDWKLTLNGRDTEELPVVDKVFLANLAEDPGESHNRFAEESRLGGELMARALAWRTQIEAEWKVFQEQLPANGLTCLRKG
ncbi:MAG: DUF229 domain-containing protein [Lentisphaerae bacterium]|nr:MAG: DUF229 domain-containing protein [Lentisphaerota bacterium]